MRRTYDDWCGDLTDLFIRRSKSGEDTIMDAMQYWHDKGYLEDMWQQGEGVKAAYDFLKTQDFYSGRPRMNKIVQDASIFPPQIEILLINIVII